jgi:hypothetical protein
MYQQMMDTISGSSAIMKGQVKEGDQLSAEAISSLQSAASSRVALKAKYLAGSVKECTSQVYWLIRATKEENIEMQVQMPDGSKSQVNWESDKQIFDSGDEEAIEQLVSSESSLVDIKAGTGEPNGKQAMQAQAMQLYNSKAIPRRALLDTLQWPDRESIVKEMEQQEKDDLQNEAFGRKVGMNFRRLERKDESEGAAKKV